MNYGDLKALVMSESHRADLEDDVPGFIRRAEAMIARECRATEMLLIAPLIEADRTTADSPLYNLPSDFLEDRTVVAEGALLTKVSRDALLRTSESGSVLVYYMRGTSTAWQIEFRAIPATDAELELEYYARPAALADDADTNRLLEAHETVYLHAALFALYSKTQDLELAQASLDTWTDAVGKLNEQAGRYLGGTQLSRSMNLGHVRTGGSY